MGEGYAFHASTIQRHIELVPTYARLLHERPDLDIGSETLAAVLGASASFAERILVPINRAGDLQGCRLVDGRVRVPDSYHEAWRELTANAWNSVDQPAKYGGQGLASFINAGCRELFDRACMAIGMLSGPSAAGRLLLSEYAAEDLQEEWIPQLVAGKWSATICISEADAGSDVGRIRTRAVQDQEGNWRITGEKMWTSFGDNDLVERIGHMLLARVQGAPDGTQGLSLFLVPNTLPGTNRTWIPNGVFPRRIEEKLGLHGSPTCAMGFEGARAYLLGTVNRGMAQMFVMIQAMRLMVAIEGAGISFGAEQLARRYAAERKQGGPPNRPAVAIDQHADIQRQLLAMAARVEVLRALVYELAVRIDAERHDLHDEAERNVTQWLLPIAKASCAEAAFDIPNAAIQILGGAGYTREWPCEQLMRDARMMSIAEGSTGIQALDLLHRRLLRDDGRSLRDFVDTVSAEIAGKDGNEVVARVLARLVEVADGLLGMRQQRGEAEAGAVAFLHLSMLAVTGWLALRLTTDPNGDPIAHRFGAAARFWLSDLDARAEFLAQEALAGASRLNEFKWI